MRDKADRFQYQPWYVKLWRYRHYIPIPVMAIKFWYAEKTRKLEDKNDWRASFKNMWGLAIGLQQSKMNWVYDWDEVKERLEKKVKDGNLGT